MHKKSFILVSVILFVLCIFSGIVAANNDVKNGISNVTNTVVDGVNNLGADVRGGIGAAENGIEDALKIDGNKTNNSNMVNTATARGNINNGYTATRTATNALTGNNTSTLWIWLMVAIVAIVIIGLVWYYGAQNNTHHNDE